MKLKIFQIIGPYFFLVLAAIVTSNISPLQVNITKQDSAINFNNNFFVHLTRPIHTIVSEFLWITTLIESDLEHYKKRDNNSWLFLRFQTLHKIDPYFLRSYRLAGPYLSIIKDDLMGADAIFKKGLAYYPLDYNLIYNMAFLQTFELKDLVMGEYYYKQASIFPNSPIFINSILKKIAIQNGADPEIILKLLLISYHDQSTPKHYKTKLHHEIYNLKAQIDLSCLNNRSDNCSYFDFDNNAYILDKKSGRYTAAQSLNQYKLFYKN